MNAKILQHNGEVVYRSTNKPLKIAETANEQVQLDMQSCIESNEECLGAKLTCNELEEVGIPDTPQYILFVNKDQNKMTFLDLGEEIMPDAGDKYVSASITEVNHTTQSQIGAYMM